MESGVNNQKREFWKKHIQKWQDSGLSQPAYCENHQLKLSTFAYYRNRLNQSNQESRESVNFVSVSTAQTLKSSQSLSGLQLQLPNGIRIGISSNVTEALLQMVLNIAGQVKC
jgi:hypothetical protein